MALNMQHWAPSWRSQPAETELPLLPETVRSFWLGDRLPPLVRACLGSFVRMGHRVELHSYQSLDVPDGVTLADAARILPAGALAPFRGHIAAFADLFRYQLLHERGGWWVDTDVYCLTATLPAVERAWAPEANGRINNAILKFPAGDPDCGRLLRLARERATEPNQWDALGPALVTEVLGQPLDPSHGGNRVEFYPLHWLEAHYIWLPEYRVEVEARLEGGVFLHLWMKALTDCGIALNHAPPIGSWLASVTIDEAWPRRKLPWHDWRTRRSIERYHGAPSVRTKLASIENERAARRRAHA